METKKFKINSSFDSYLSSNLSRFLSECGEEEQKPPIEIEINSGGGDVMAGNSMIGAMIEYTGDKYAKIEGVCASMAAIFAICSFKKENISMRSNAVFMTHGARKSSGFEQQTEQSMSDDLALIKIINSNFCDALMKKTGLTMDECKAKFLDGNKFFSAQECLDMGLIGEILPSVISFEMPKMAANESSFGELISEINLKLTNMSELKDKIEVVEKVETIETTKEFTANASEQIAVISELSKRVESMQFQNELARKTSEESIIALANFKTNAEAEKVDIQRLVDAQKSEIQAHIVKRDEILTKNKNLVNRMLIERQFAAVNQSNGVVLSAEQIESLTDSFFNLNSVDASGEQIKIVSKVTNAEIKDTLKTICTTFAAHQLPVVFGILKGNGFQSSFGASVKIDTSEKDRQLEIDKFDAEWRASNPITNKIGSAVYSAAYSEKFPK